MTLNEKLFLAAVFLVVIVTVGLIPENPKSRELLTRPSPVDWARVRDDKSRTLTFSWQGIIAHQAGQDGSWIQRNPEQRFNLYITDDKKQVLQTFLQRIVIESSTQMMELGVTDTSVVQFTGETLKAATIIVTILPIICVYPFVQKYFVKGIMLGGVKE